MDDVPRDSEIAAAFDRDEPSEALHSLAPRNRISAILGHASEQLADPAEKERAYRIVWCVCDGRNSEVFFDEIRATLYGSTNLIDLGDMAWRSEALYYYESSFFRYSKYLDAVAITREGTGQLCLNDHSPKFPAIVASEMARSFKGGVYDPAVLGADGSIVRVDARLDRKKVGEVTQYLQQKLGRRMIMNVDMGYHAVWTGLQVDR